MSTLLVVGTGLIGGSFALSARAAGCFEQILGFDRDRETLALAERRGIIDRAVGALGAGAAGADAVFVAVPTAVTAAVLAELWPAGEEGPGVVFDGASVKAPVIDELRRRLGRLPATFVPAHPMAGGERRGPGAASERLFRGRRVFLTPTPGTHATAIARVRGYWRAVGAEVHESDAHLHDARVALTSHLPHLLAYAYMGWIAAQQEPGTAGGDAGLGAYTGPGFQDFTRIAGANAAQWREILEANAVYLRRELEGVSGVLARWRALLEEGRFDELEQGMARAQAVQHALAARAAEGADGPARDE